MSKSASRSQKDREDREYGLEQLKHEHKSLEERLDSLNRPPTLSAEEEAEMQVIKKRKLAIKDQLILLQAT